MKLWKLSGPLTSAASSAVETHDVSLLAEFSSCFGMRIMCVDASVEDEVISVSITAMFLGSIAFFILFSLYHWTDSYYIITMVN